METKYLLKIIPMVLLIIALSSFALADSNSLLDKTCTSYGYDFGIAKWAWNTQSSSYELILTNENYTTSVSGTDIQAIWTSNKNVTGVVSEEGCYVQVTKGGIAGTINRYSDNNNIQYITLCADNPKEDALNNAKNNDVPEFGGFAAIFVFIFTGIFIMKKRKKGLVHRE